MKNILYCICFFLPFQFLNAQSTLFETSEGLKSASYTEGIDWWQKLSKANEVVQMHEYGQTDAGYPLHLIWIGNENLDQIRSSSKSILLINNAIHPGEPDGVDASMMLFRDLLKKTVLLENVIPVCIPYYNIGGALNRGRESRANQKGPLDYGFRGNAQLLDLNRDFIKCDSKNALSFAALLQKIDPDVYIETHVSNGADYQYDITYLASQPDKLGHGMGAYLREEMVPSLNQSMNKLNEPVVPYVNHHGGPLLNEYTAFYDSPRYSTGLTSLHQIFGFITETHMLKDYQSRVDATYKFLASMLKFCNENSSEIQRKRLEAKRSVSAAKTLALSWKLDSSKYVEFPFYGYQHAYKKSQLTGGERLYYNTDSPLLKQMKFYAYYQEEGKVTKPKQYILQRGFHKVAQRLRANGVQLTELQKDTVLAVISYKIEDFKTVAKAYESHYLHSNTQASKESIVWAFKKGDWLIEMGTDKDRFVMETLEPFGPDSYFNWNFFDAILQQKEWYSPYVFEEKAEKFLQKYPKVKLEFLNLKKEDKSFREDARAQLYWIYQKSPYYEPSHMRLPVFRID